MKNTMTMLWSTLSFVIEMELELQMLRFSNDIMIQQFNSRLWINFSNSVHWTVGTCRYLSLVTHCQTLCAHRLEWSILWSLHLQFWQKKLDTMQFLSELTQDHVDCQFCMCWTAVYRIQNESSICILLKQTLMFVYFLFERDNDKMCWTNKCWNMNNCGLTGIWRWCWMNK